LSSGKKNNMKSLSSILLFLISSTIVVAQAIPTNQWVLLWSDSTKLFDSTVEPGSIIRAYDPQSVLCGQCTVKTTGSYGLMAVYRDDPTTVADEGALPGDTLSFTIDGHPALSLGPGEPLWQNNGDVIKLNLKCTSAYLLTPEKLHAEVVDTVRIRAQIVDGINAPLKLPGRTVHWTSFGGGTFLEPTTSTDSLGQTSALLFNIGIDGKYLIAATDEYGSTGRSDSIYGPPSFISVSTSLLTFGNVGKTDTATAILSIGNKSSVQKLVVTQIHTSTSVFSFAISAPITINEGGSISLMLKFTVNGSVFKGFRTYWDTLTIESTGGSRQIILTGNSPFPTVVLQRDKIYFGQVSSDVTQVESLTVSNTSVNPLVIDSVYTGTSSFVTDVAMGSIGQADTLRIVVRFAPAGFGSFLDTLFLRNNSATPVVKIPLSGSSPSPMLTLSTQSLAFGPVALTDTAIGTIKLFNQSSVNKLTVSQISNRAPAYKFAVNLPLIINPNDSAQILIKFNINSITPDGYGYWPDTLQITSDGGNARVALMGLSPRPAVLFSKRLIQFGEVGIYDTSSVNIAVANSSRNPLRIDSIVNRTSAFFPSVRSLSVTNKDTVKLVLYFVPTQFGFQTDSLLVWSNADTYLIYVDLSGNSPYPAIETHPPQIDFGTVKKDSTRQKLFSIQDTSISRLQVDSLWTGTRYFDVVRHLANRIVRKGDSAAISIRFTPDSSRQFIDTLYIANSSLNSPAKIPLGGNGSATSILRNESELPKAYSLSQNFPNPFNPSTTLRYGLSSRSRVRLQVYNILGQVVADLADNEQSAGWNQVVWNANVSSGLYFYRLDAVSVSDPSKRFVDVKKMILLK
jgi:hypothetical protein